MSLGVSIGRRIVDQRGDKEVGLLIIGTSGREPCVLFIKPKLELADMDFETACHIGPVL